MYVGSLTTCKNLGIILITVLGMLILLGTPNSTLVMHKSMYKLTHKHFVEEEAKITTARKSIMRIQIS